MNPGECVRAANDPQAMTANERLLLAQYAAMTEWEKAKFMQFMIRVRNNDAKVLRLAGMVERGEMSREQLLKLM